MWCQRWEEVPYLRLPLEGDATRPTVKIGTQDLDDHPGPKSRDYAGSLAVEGGEVERNIFWFVKGNEVSLVETCAVGGANVGNRDTPLGRLKLLFGGALLPGARMFKSDGGRSLTFLCATATGGYVWEVTFTLSRLVRPEGAFFDTQPRAENLQFEIPLAGAFGCEIQHGNIAVAMAAPDGTVWLVRPGWEPHKVTGIHSGLDRIFTPVKALWRSQDQFQVVALHVIALPHGDMNDGGSCWGIIGTCDDKKLRLWSRNGCEVTTAQDANALPLPTSFELVGTERAGGDDDNEHDAVWSRESCCGHSLATLDRDDWLGGMPTSKFVVGFSHGYGQGEQQFGQEKVSYTFVTHTIVIPQGGCARWESAYELPPDAMLPELGSTKLVCFEVSPRGDLGVILWREPMYSPAPIGECVVYKLRGGEYENGERHRLLTGTFHAHDDLRLGFDEVQEWVEHFAALNNADVAALQQGGWCLKMSNNGCQLVGDPDVVRDIMSNQSVFAALIKAAVATVLVAPGGYPAAAVESAMRQSGMDQRLVESLGLRKCVIEALGGLHVGVEQAAKLEQLARQASAMMTVPVGICARGLAGHTVILRRDAIGAVMNVMEAAISRNDDDLEEMMHLLYQLDGPYQQAHSIQRLLELSVKEVFGTGGRQMTAQEAREAILEGLEKNHFVQLKNWLDSCDNVVVGHGVSTGAIPGGGRLTYMAQQWEIAKSSDNNEGDEGWYQSLCDALKAFFEAGGTFSEEPSFEAEFAPHDELVIDDTEFAGTPTLNDVYKLFLRRIHGSQRKFLIRRLMHYKTRHDEDGYKTGDGLKRFLDDAEVLMKSLAGQPDVQPNPDGEGRVCAAPHSFTVGFSQRVLDVRYAISKRLALFLTFAVLPNVRSESVDCAPVGLAKHRLTQAVLLLRSVFVAKRLAHLPVHYMKGDHTDDTLALIDDNCKSSALPSLLLTDWPRTLDIGASSSVIHTALWLARELIIWLKPQDQEQDPASLNVQDGEIEMCKFLKAKGQFDALGHYLQLLGRDSPAFLYYRGYVSLAHAYRTLQRAGMAASATDATEMRDHADTLYSTAIVSLVEAAPTAFKNTDTMQALEKAGAIKAGNAPHWFKVCSYYVNDARGTVEELRRHRQWHGCYMLAQMAMSALTAEQREAFICEDVRQEWCDGVLGATREEWLKKKLDEVKLQYFQATVELLKQNPMDDEALHQCYNAVYNIDNVIERQSAVRSLVKALVPRSGQRNIRALCAFPFVGLQEEVETVLWLEARQMDVKEMTEGYYHILHAFFTARKDYRSASHSMLEYAFRLMLLGRADCVQDLRRQMGGFLAAANALRLVREEAPTEGEWFTQANTTSGRYVVIDVREQAPQSKRKRKNGGGAAEESDDTGEQRKARVVVSLGDLQKWSAISTAYVCLAELPQPVLPQPSRHRGVDPPPVTEVIEVMKQMRRYKLYEAATKLGQAYKLPLEPVLEDLAAWCVQRQKSNNTAIVDDDRDLSKRRAYADDSNPVFELSDTPALQLLSRLLTELDGKGHGGETTNFSLHLAVMDRLLQEDQYIGFPAPLLTSLRCCVKRSGLCIEKPSQSMVLVSVILGVALRHPTHPWLLHDAAGVVIQALRTMARMTPEERQSDSSRFVPFSLLDRFMTLLLHMNESHTDQGGWCSSTALKTDYEQICTSLQVLNLKDYRSFDSATHATQSGTLKWCSESDRAQGLDSDASWEPQGWSWSRSQQLYW